MRRHFQSISRFLVVVTWGLVMAACGGDDGTAPATPGAPVTPPVVDPGAPAAPTAAFTAPASASVNQVVVFDASASTSADGSALSYVWDFGNGLRGGGKTIARSFGADGARSVTLTVIDGGQRSGSTSHTLTVSAPSAGTSVTVTGKITGTDGSPIDGVSVTRVGADTSTAAVSDSTGKVSLAVARATAVTLKLSKTGYADQFVQLNLPASTGSDAYFEAVQRPRDAALTLADAAVGGTLTGRDGAGITVPASAFVDTSGKAVTGPIQMAVTPVDATQSGGGGFPGQFDGIKPDGSTTPIVSFGAVEFIPTSSAGRLQLAPGKTASIDVPIYGAKRPDGTVVAVGDSIPLWSLDETTSMWIQEGTGQVVASATSPSGLAMRATVSHLTWWNADVGFDPFGPQPKCVTAGDIGIPGAIDSFAAATVCNMLAEIDRNLSGASSSRARALADAPDVRYAGYSRRLGVPIAGGVPLPVPPGLDVRLTAHALNGTWSGTKVVNGPVGARPDVLVEMRPTGTTGSAPQTVTPPFDAERTLLDGQTSQYNFTGSSLKFARVTVSTDDVNSTLVGRLRLLQGATVLGSANFGGGNGSASLIAAFTANATTITAEITGLANAPGGYHLKIEVLGDLQTEALGYGFAVTKDLPALTRYRATFTSSGVAAYFGLRNDRVSAGPESLRIFAADGSVVASAGGSAASVLSQTVVSLPAGSYTAEALLSDGAAGKVSIRGEPTSWLPVAEVPPISAITYRGMIDLIADRNGRPVIGYWDDEMAAQPRMAALRLRRWTGTAWETVGTDQTVALGSAYCSTGNSVPIPRPRMASFAFDSNNNPLIAYRIDQDASNSNSLATTTVRTFVNGSWQAVGPNDGKLPVAAHNGFTCDDPPMIGTNAANQPVVAYRTDAGVTVQRYDGTAWKGLADATADSFADAGDQNGNFALGFDAARQIYLALAGESTVVVRRFNAQSTAWETVGPNGGTATSVNNNARYFNGGRFTFSASGAPTLALFALVPVAGSPSAYSPVVYRYDGSAWTTSIYPLGANQGGLPFFDAVAIALSGSDAMVSWAQGINSDWFAPVVQRNTASSWTPIGGGIGEIPQFTRRGINTPQMLVTSPLLLQTSDGLYLATLVTQNVSGGGGSYRLVLSRKVAD